jgi:hypothetical protein
MPMTRAEARRLQQQKAQSQEAPKPRSAPAPIPEPEFDSSDPFSAPGAPVDGCEEGAPPVAKIKTIAPAVVAVDTDGDDDETDVPQSEPKTVPAPANNVDGIQRIIESVFQIDFEATWKDLHRVLRATEEPVKGIPIRKVLAGIDDACRRAHKLYVNMRLQLAMFEIDVEKTRAAMRSEAYAKLQAEKEQGLRNKAITEGDINAYMVTHHADEYKASERKLQEFKLAVDHAENLVKCMFGKSRSLQVETMKGSNTDADD